MQERIDDFIKVATERNADPAMYRLYQQLVGLCAEDDRKKLHVAWNTLTTIKELAKWDEDFLEETINPSPTTVTAPAGFNHLAQGQSSMGNTNSNSLLTLSNNSYAQQAAYAQAQMANANMRDYYYQLDSGSIGTSKPLSYYDSIKTALGL